jgi:uncharacterized protein
MANVERSVDVIRVVRYDSVEPQPWVNGGGVTRVLVAGRAADSHHPFDWRLSIADVDSGEFSALPGIDRVITQVDGPPMTLDVDGVAVALEPFVPFRFAGESRTSARTLGPARDFNVMTRRTECQATVEIRNRPGRLPTAGADLVYVVPLKGSASVSVAGGLPVALGRYDLAVVTVDAEMHCEGDGFVAVVWVRRCDEAGGG